MILPSWAPELRVNQVLSIDNILGEFGEGSNVVFLEAPTGTGKTLIAEMVRQQLDARGVYLCSSLSLQHQFQRDFPDAAVLMGRNNYPTLDHPGRFNKANEALGLSCADCNKKKVGDGWVCSWCSTVSQCPYESAKAFALRSPLVCSNSYYFLYEANYVGTLSHRDLVIVDEVDTLESVLMSFVEVNISERRVAEFNLPAPAKKTVQSSWEDWVLEAESIAKKQRVGASQGEMFESQPDLRILRKGKRLDSLLGDLKRLLHPEYGLASGNWVYDGYGQGNIIFKPITVAPYAKEFLWRHGKKWLLMSATIISTNEMASSLGLI